MDKLKEATGNSVDLNAILCWDLKNTNDIALLVQYGESLQLMADQVSQEVARVGLVINQDKAKSLDVTIKQPTTSVYNQLSINQSGWDINRWWLSNM